MSIDEAMVGRRDGAGARIAVVDSGVEPRHPWFEGARLSHQRLERSGKGYDVVPDEGGDASGHGTACAGIIHRMVPAAEIVSLRALGPDGRCSRNALISAIHHCIKARFDVVNLSLGIDMPRKMPLKVSDHHPILRLYELCDVAYTVGVALVAAGPNVEHLRTYPGRFKSLIGVGRAPFADTERIGSQPSQDFEILAPGTDVLAPALGGKERRWTGTSFAAPFVSAHVARLRAAHPEMPVHAIKSSLHRLAEAQARGETGAAEAS